MFGFMRTVILTISVCTLGIAWLFTAQKPLLEKIFSSPTSSVYVQELSKTETARPQETLATTTPEIKTTKTEQEPQDILGTPPEKLKTAQEERPVTKEPLVSTIDTPTRLSSQMLYALASERVVNLFCELPNNEIAIATGVIIHPRGYILTNAHVAEAEQSHTCLIRRGSPAQNFAIAERVFLPLDFSSKIHTRENLAQDVAIWKITSTIEKNIIGTLPFFSISPDNLPVDGAALATFSYPAELLGSHAVVSALYLSFSETQIVSHDAYFIESTQGLGSQKGSSGGILLDPFTGELAGLIFAINNSKTEYISDRTLFSLTPFAIHETIRAITGKELNVYLDENP
ncbi:MAG: hypothetical protein A3J54_02725 [Candidatus Ryanbacteria bacterium RIFCSPHIGHO2_02_FULL_45_13b]|uniref:Serine protease n=1 Tax=Candidatus Ryanbacteria bacterium RIFCSPHIGHO2_02_FULL_45_13b TaxID=1802117 RepID=A0A1G2G8S8_9BACT|nr:MAG: hypothetical protein A3J54_02725 [Candidatus Ryanbacteria bacterium RIFCSPHIGHO2_02_FULL_45_13b]